MGSPNEITARELKASLDNGDKIHLLDIREPEEHQICAIEGAEHIPMLQLFAGLQVTEADREEPLVVFCHHGIRSLQAAEFLTMQGFQNVRSLSGGIDGWALEIDASLRRY